MAAQILDWHDDLERWLEPLLDRLGHKARQRMCPLYIAGLIGPGERKSVQPMAERLAAGRYDQLHHFVGSDAWNAAPLEAELLVQADRLAGGHDAVLRPAAVPAGELDERSASHGKGAGSYGAARLP